MDITADTTPDELVATHRALRTAWQARRPDLDQRRADLKRLRDAFRAQVPAMDAAIRADFGHRSEHENLISEAMVVIAEIDHALAHLRRWARPRRAAVGWRFWPARAQVRPVPVGVVGILSPWNYPVNLALMPLVSAIAAGNHVYLKPSEHTPRTSAWLRELLAEVFPADRVAVALGGPGVGATFAGLPFDHLLFTGSTAVGRKVMAAAAPNLTPVTLELGGKAPAVICPDFPVDKAAARIATGKWINAGQTCIGVDYVLVDAARRDAFVDAVVAELRARYGDIAGSLDYTRIINEAQHARLQGYLDDARARGLQVIAPFGASPAGAADEVGRLLPPTLVIEPGPDAEVMRHEIFGPILPVLSYTSLDDAIGIIQRLPRPLALYPFTRDEADLARILDGILPGGVTVNDTLVHFGVHGLPFGGIGPSGMGQIHGRHGFDTFSKQLPVLRQAHWAGSDLIKPPYTGKIDRMIRWLAK
ncbi:aldehyde dehydrogenase family protein [Marilutibacter chinensis]|uniref:Aldehyde dehydrogenase n=1 Tax=Marilutibacter chinensis TaxID=2912247 RepID=A0ABS9HZI0_9GAMM|nr:aldehyde dehydrogenase family protein [Lysobacter chinensis]MCF7223549.1 aldehyde dehydrogenase family protein [Lysobacter chinensis]